ncbi:MAG: DUF4062 domain-containing protein [Sedimentisphaerales bacterium]|jgi:hypothetical protein
MKVFISSTYEDLTLHRSTVGDSLDISGIQFNAMEHFGSTPRPPIQTCLNAVDSSDAFIGVLGVRYGGTPPRCRQSYTEREYRRARSKGLPILMFLIDERDATVAPQYVVNETPNQRRRLRALKKFVRNHHTVTFFKNPDDLARLVLASLIREFGAIP